MLIKFCIQIHQSIVLVIYVSDSKFEIQKNIPDDKNVSKVSTSQKATLDSRDAPLKVCNIEVPRLEFVLHSWLLFGEGFYLGVPKGQFLMQ